jgi:hypothetical protein
MPKSSRTIRSRRTTRLPVEHILFQVDCASLCRLLRRRGSAACCTPALRAAEGDAAYPAPATPGYLHINVGTPGIEDDPDLIEDGQEALFAALRERRPTVPAIISGELERALGWKLIDAAQLRAFRRRLRLNGRHVLSLD